MSSAQLSDDPSLPDTQNQYITVINKKIRALKKKTTKVAEIEKKVEKREEINKDQKELLATKDVTVRALQEFLSIRDQFLKIETDEEAKQKVAPAPTQQSPQPVEQKQQETQVQQPAVDERAHVLLLLKLVQASKMLDPSIHEGVQARQVLLAEKANSKTITNNSDFDRIHWLTNAIFNIAVAQESLDACMEHAMKFLKSSEDDFVPNVSYNLIREELDELNSSSIFAQQQPQQTESVELQQETSQEEQQAEVQAENDQGQETSADSSAAIGEEEEQVTDDTNQSSSNIDNNDQPFSTREYKRGGRGRGGRGGGRGGRGRGGSGGGRGGSRNFDGESRGGRGGSRNFESRSPSQGGERQQRGGGQAGGNRGSPRVPVNRA